MEFKDFKKFWYNLGSELWIVYSTKKVIDKRELIKQLDYSILNRVNNNRIG